MILSTLATIQTTTVYTLGYEQSEPEAYIKRLQEHNISLVVDVRYQPISRKRGFSKNQLCKLLTESGIGYLHYQTLGAPKELRENLRISKSWSDYVKQYNSQVLQHRTEELESLTNLLHQERVSLLCFERDASTCHRSLIAQEIMKRNRDFPIEVYHIEY